jgi:hypothetical protein
MPVFDHDIRDLFQVWLKRMAEVIGAEVAPTGSHAAKIHLQWHGLDPDW